MSLLQKFVSRAGGIGAEPTDTEQVRLLKQIWTITLVLAVPSSGAISLVYFLLHQVQAALYWLILAVFCFGSLLLFATVRRHIENFALSSQAFLVLSSFIMTCLLRGFFRSDGVIFMGLIGVLYSMVFPSRRRALIIVFLYLSLFAIALFLELTVFKSDTGLHLTSLFIFWSTFAIATVFTVFTLNFFIGQRDRAYRLMEAEKERSEGLLRRIEKDLELAAKIQKDFLPRHDPRIERFDISGSNISCYEVGGDYYDFVPVDPYRLGIALGDVSGKGIGAALLMASLRAAFRAEVHPRYRMEDMAAKLNDFVHHSSAISSFITFFYCEIDRNRDEIRYLNAGHNPPLVLRTDGALEALDGTGFCLGMFSGAVYESKSIRLNPGDIVLLYTDGIPESRNVRDEDYTLDRLVSLLRRNAARPAVEIVAAIAQDAKSYINGALQCDDQTLVVIKKI